MWSFKDFRFFVYSVTLLSQPVYWSLSSLMGQDVSIHDSAGRAFVAYNVFLFALTILFSFKDIKIRKISQGNRLLFGVILIYVVSFFVESLFSDATNTEWFGKSFLFFIMFGISGTLIGVVFWQKGTSQFYKHIDFLTFLIGIGYIRSIPMMIVAGDMLGGYQDIAYYSALSFGFLFYGLITNRSDRCFIFKYKLFRYLSAVIGVLLVICVLSSGGRGGLVLLVVEMFFCGYLLLKGKNLGSSIVVLSVLFVFILIVSNYIMNSSVNEIVNVGMERGLSYIDSGKIDITETSNRDLVYREHVNRIKDNPFLGEGIYTVLGKYEWPHNFFLELLATGGIFLLLLWLCILVKCYKNYKRLVKVDRNNQYLVPLILYVLIFLLFSSSYMETRVFWFTITVLLSVTYKYSHNNLNHWSADKINYV